METAIDRFALLAEAAIAFERGLDLDDTLRAIVEAARKVTGARYAALGVLGPDRRIARFVTAGLNDAEVATIGAPPTGRGLLGALIDDATLLRLTDLTRDPRAVGFPPGHPPMRSFLGVPVRARGTIFGNLYLTEAPGDAFTDEDEAIVTLLAAKAGVAIENARLYAEATRQAREAQRAAQARASVAIVAASILRERDVARVMTALAAEAGRLVNARIAAIGIADEIGRSIRFPVVVGDDLMIGLEIPIDGSLTGTVLEAGEAMRIDDAATFAAVDAPLVEVTGARTLMAVPMMDGDEAIAVITVADRDGGEPFTAEDQDLLEGLGLLGAVALQTARAFARERARAEALARLRQAEATAEERRAALERVVAAQERERRRIAQDLHDRTAGALAAVQLSLARLEREGDIDKVRRALVEARGDIAGAIDDLRDLIVDLRPKVLDDFGLGPALERLSEATARRGGITVDVAVSPSLERLTPERASAAYRIVQEALTNVLRHARARRVQVSATIDDGRLAVVVEDDGIGAETAADGPSGLGIVGMRERAAIVDGSIQVERPTGGGTRIVFEAPT